MHDMMGDCVQDAEERALKFRLDGGGADDDNDEFGVSCVVQAGGIAIVCK